MHSTNPADQPELNERSLDEIPDDQILGLGAGDSVDETELDEDVPIDLDQADLPVMVPRADATEGSVFDFEITIQHEEKRIDIFLADLFSEFSRVKLRKAISDGYVCVDDKVVKPSFRLYDGQKVRFTVPPQLFEVDQRSEDIELDIIYEDDAMIVVNKPAGMVVHPAKGHWRGTLTSALLFRFAQLSAIGGATRPGIVHRLDRDTSGVILVAKTDRAHMALVEQFQQRTVQKQYFAIVSPAPTYDQDIINQPIGKHPYQRERMAVRENHETSREAESLFKVVKRFKGFASVQVFPKTGRTHQIRVHMAHIGCPILCDRLYSGRASITEAMLHGKTDQCAANDQSAILNRQALHAEKISFNHPTTGKPVSFTAPLPNDIATTLDALERIRSL